MNRGRRDGPLTYNMRQPEANRVHAAVGPQAGALSASSLVESNRGERSSMVCIATEKLSMSRLAVQVNVTNRWNGGPG
jgi:hypothetical protein